MSARHKHFGGGQNSQVIDRLLKDPKIRELLHRPRQINRDYDLPYLGGTSEDGHTIYLDRHLPDRLTYEVDGVTKEFNPVPFICDHEDFERACMDGIGWEYAHAHQAATGFERRNVVRAGLAWNRYESVVEKHVKADEHEKLVKVPPDLDMRPYLAPPVDKTLVAHMRKVMGKEGGNKQSKAEVEYTDTRGSPARHCGPTYDWTKGYCSMYRKPNTCTAVKGYIDPKGGCEIFKKAKNA